MLGAKRRSNLPPDEDTSGGRLLPQVKPGDRSAPRNDSGFDDSNPPFDLDARRTTVSITLNGDLVAKATEAGINISRTAEAALARAYAAFERERVRQELREAARMVDEYVALHGMPFEDWANHPAADAGHAA